MANYSEHGGITFLVYGDATDLDKMLYQEAIAHDYRLQFSAGSPHAILELIGNLASVVVPLAGVIVAWLHNRRKGSIEVVRKDGSKISLQGLTEEQIATILGGEDIANLILDARHEKS
ncbi:effector-associated constant component EACC1 [Aeromonas hydrophila]